MYVCVRVHVRACVCTRVRVYACVCLRTCVGMRVHASIVCAVGERSIIRSYACAAMIGEHVHVQINTRAHMHAEGTRVPLAARFHFTAARADTDVVRPSPSRRRPDDSSRPARLEAGTQSRLLTAVVSSRRRRVAIT